MEFRSDNKIIVILGPTASGKSDVAIRLAQKFDGEIISADSRQIYRGMDIGSGKITEAEQKMVPHHMLDIASPKTEYNAAKFKKKTEKIIKDILKRGKVPIICGGTGFWIKALVDNVDFPEVKPNQELRIKMQELSTEILFNKLKKLDPERAKNIDAKNKVRLIRAIEICKAIGKVPPMNQESKIKNYDFLQIGIAREKEELNERIKKNVTRRFSMGMIEEVKDLHEKYKLSWKKIQSFGLSYNLIPEYLKGNIKNKEELKEKIYLAEKNYAKRQRTWFAKDKRIIWIPIEQKEKNKYANIEKEVSRFIEK
ncbi:MAG: tRNA dimethylallyltransferase [Candidatus Moranbacteria bacterium GW2011_GWE2_35_2-]|nr:MAG: tRNA dimethylallyltransferase [Candidatus Moranbacteria bacterium GW2011_GWE2_35_2-]KKQ06904.1 MAG: tRNA dimethylallyltransferase [Candidatus Moranbacteria bacterium GW2011_GWF1_36_4]KKQ22100.1 MAG: tRNA dimethylallyltransferase [Candidatus Moranbacteria bacterium GW2011_GWF2_37_11]KKQ29147.1 MAG: tRNA dimethylallyltransferase [Candidatus Moranbacteria bacterium GW2011_GWD1_37_17]KKQ31132.1 MAG: tRNA dimethylallyltransferase [Candidatus Moranbacteria bacterium GW2011_GWE1_37_24]KKQ4706